MSNNIPQKAEDEELKLRKTLYGEQMLPAITLIGTCLFDMMTDSYFRALWDPDDSNTDKLIRFFVPITKIDTNKNVSILNRYKLIEKCHKQTKEIANLVAWNFWNYGDEYGASIEEVCEDIENGNFIEKNKKEKASVEYRAWLLGWDKKGKYNIYDRIPNQVFEKLVRKEFENVGDDPDCVEAYFKCMDLTTCFKVHQKMAGDAASCIFQALNAKGALKQIKEVDFGDLCKEAVDGRNVYYAHSDRSVAEELLNLGGPEKELKTWIEIVEHLHSEKLNEECYKAVKKAWDEAVKLHKSGVFFFSDLLQYIQDPALSDRDESDLYNAAESLKIACREKGALYDGNKEDLIVLLENKMRADIRIPLEDLNGYINDDIDDLEAYLNRFGFKVRDGAVRGHSIDEVINFLCLRVVREQSGNNDWGDLPKLDELAKYEGGPMTEEQLYELVKTHKLMLDASVVCSQVGREFIRDKLFKLIKNARSDNPGQKNICLWMDETTFCNIQKNHDNYQRCNTKRKYGDESASTISNVKELKPYENAYKFINNCNKKGFLQYWVFGEKYRDGQGREILLKGLKANPERRFCVLTCGAVSELVVEGDNVISHNELPLCAVARVQGDYYYPDAKMQPGPNCQIFSQYLPLEIGGTPVDFDKPLLDRMRLPGGDEYSAEAFGVSTEDGGLARTEEMSVPEPKQSSELTIQKTEIL